MEETNAPRAREEHSSSWEFHNVGLSRVAECRPISDLIVIVILIVILSYPISYLELQNADLLAERWASRSLLQERRRRRDFLLNPLAQLTTSNLSKSHFLQPDRRSSVYWINLKQTWWKGRSPWQQCQGTRPLEASPRTTPRRGNSARSRPTRTVVVMDR